MLRALPISSLDGPTRTVRQVASASVIQHAPESLLVFEHPIKEANLPGQCINGSRTLANGRFARVHRCVGMLVSIPAGWKDQKEGGYQRPHEQLSVGLLVYG